MKEFPIGHPRLIDALVKIGDKRAIPTLISMLSAKLRGSRRRYPRRTYSRGGDVVRALIQFGKPAIPALLKALQHENKHVRAKSAEALGTIGGEDVVPALIKCLTDEEAYVREAVAMALGCIGDKRAVEPIIKLFKDKYLRVIRNAIFALRNIGGKRAVTHICEFIREKENEGRKSRYKRLYFYTDAIRALKDIGDKQAFPILISALKNKRPYIVYLATEGLVKIDDKSAVPALFEVLKKKNGYIAAKALGELRAKSAVPVLIESLKREDQWIRRESARALGKIGDKSAIPALEGLLKDKALYARIYVAEALCKLGARKKSMPVLLGALYIKKGDNHNPYPRLEAAGALYTLGDEKGLKILEEATKWPENSGGYIARKIFCQVADKAVVPTLIKVLKSSHYLRALEALKRINEKSTIHLLIDSLKGDIYDIYIFSALKKLSGRNFGNDKARWQKWWDANKARILKEESATPKKPDKK